MTQATQLQELYRSDSTIGQVVHSWLSTWVTRAEYGAWVTRVEYGSTWVTRVARVAGEIVWVSRERRTRPRQSIPRPVRNDADTIQILLLILIRLGLAVAVGGGLPLLPFLLATVRHIPNKFVNIKGTVPWQLKLDLDSSL